MEPIHVGIVLWLISLAVFRTVSLYIRWSLSFVKAKNQDIVGSEDSTKLLILASIQSILWGVLLPFIAIVLGTIYPDQTRILLGESVGAAALIMACISTISAQFFVVRQINEVCSKDIRNAIVNLVVENISKKR